MLPSRAVRAQQPVTIGYLYTQSSNYMAPYQASVLQGLKEQGYSESTNLRIISLAADGKLDRLPALARQLVDQKVDLILAAGGVDPVKAATAASPTLPVVFVSAADPVRAGVVASLNRPGGNVTGVSLIGSELEPKRLEFLNRLVPGTAPLAALVSPRYSDAALQTDELRQGAAAIKRPLEVVQADAEAEFEPAFAKATQKGAVALAVTQNPLFNNSRPQLVALAARYKLPTAYTQREFAEIGGLISYGTHFLDGYRQAGIYAGRILKGAKPADLPVLQPARFELVINARTARTLGVTVPMDVLAAADEVIE
ncbi:MAG: ABC transporter substrate-binding protein [Alphaproteobacteria bacterium]|nr:ABC transporter substrate-binding protein [Alphaproteobacteria bacterium]